MGKTFVSTLIVILFSIIAGSSLLHSGLPPTHDGEYHILRFYEFDKALRDGNWYPRWAADFNNGYGIPLFNYVYPFPNYFASFLHFFKFSFIDTFKLSMFFSSVTAGIFCFLWARKFWGNLGGIVSSVFYIYAPYHFVDIYIRGSVGELWAMAFFPAFLWAITEFFKSRKVVFSILSSVFLALIIFSHNILSLMFLPFAVSYGLFLFAKQANRRYIIDLFYIFLSGIGISAIFWLPALLETKYVTGLQIYNFENKFPELYQLLIPSWGSGFSDGSLQGQMSYQIGIANILAILMSVILLVYWVKKKNKQRFILMFFLFWFFLVFFLMLPISLNLWNLIPLMNYFQFPWRFLSLVSLFCAFIAGGASTIWKKNIVSFAMIAFCFILGIGYAKPAFYHNRDDNYYLTRSNFINGTNSPGNSFNTIWFNKDLKKQSEIIVFDGKVISKEVNITNYSFNVFTNSAKEAVVNTAYFPGWKVFIDKKEVKVKPNSNGLISFSMPEGNHSIQIILDETKEQKTGFWISFLSILFIIAYLVFRSHVIIKR